MLPVSSRWRPTLLALALGAAVLPASGRAADVPVVEAARHFEIDAGPLDRALVQFGRSSGVLLSFSPEQAAGLRSAGLRGDFTPRQALQNLLRDSGLEAVRNAAGAYVLRPVGKGAAAVADAGGARPAGTTPAPAAAEAPELPTVVVTDTLPLAPGRQLWSAEDIKRTPTANQSLSELVANNPAVRQGNATGDALTRGSMAAEDLSFHGASPYQNLFQIDGMDGTNNLNPANDNANLQIGNVPSNSQAYFVDTALLGEVRVFDSNVPVEYGRFNGGVVDARLRRASGQDNVQLGFRMSGANLSEQKIAKGYEANYNSGNSGYTPDWRKRFYSLSADRKLNDDFGLVLGLSRRESDIQRMAYEGWQTQQDRVDNLLAKLSWWGDGDTVSDLTVKYAERSEQRSNKAYRSTEWHNDHAAGGLGWNFERGVAAGKLNLQLGWDRFEDRRRSSANEFVTYRVVTPSSTVTEGGFGTEQTSRDTWTAKARFDFKPFGTGPIEHTPYAGVESQWIQADFERLQDSYSYQLYRATPASVPQYRNKVLYRAGKVDLSYQNQALYLADAMRWDRVTFTPGLRLDRDSYLDNTNVAYRSKLEWDLFGNQRTVLTAGASRYYGDGILDLAFRERVSTLKQQLTNATGGAVSTATRPELTRYAGLKSPYNDEFSLALSQEFAGLQGVLSYVRRNGRDLFSKHTVVTSYEYEYRNEGRSTTDSYSLSLVNLKPWKLGPTDWRSRLTVGYIDSRRNQNLVDDYDSDVTSGQVYYNGVLINAADRPAIDFNQPLNVALQLNGAWEAVGLDWSNQFNWKSAREGVFVAGKINGLTAYEEGRLPSYLTWDSSLRYRPHFHRNLELSVEVLNVLNRMPVLSASSLTTTTNLTYLNGREIWLQANYRF